MIEKGKIETLPAFAHTEDLLAWEADLLDGALRKSTFSVLEDLANGKEGWPEGCVTAHNYSQVAALLKKLTVLKTLARVFRRAFETEADQNRMHVFSTKWSLYSSLYHKELKGFTEKCPS